MNPLPEKSPTLSATPGSVIDLLIQHRPTFLAFLVRRLGNPAEAEDLLHDSFARALRHSGELRDRERATAWFYRILRRALVDHYRKNDAARRRDEQIESEFRVHTADLMAAPELEAGACRCVNGVINILPQRAAELLRRVDLDGEPRAAVGRQLALSTASLDVALHRARRVLRKQLEQFCGSCATEHCLDCTCATAAVT